MADAYAATARSLTVIIAALNGEIVTMEQQVTASLPGARTYYHQQRDRGLDHDAALRALSNRLAGILHG